MPEIAAGISSVITSAVWIGLWFAVTNLDWGNPPISRAVLKTSP